MDVGVLIAGAGPVGLSLACELERHRVEHRTVDAARERAAVSRVTDLHARSLELWDHTGIAEAVLAAALPITGAQLFSGGREVAQLDFAGVDSPFPAAVSLRQRELEELLREHLEAPVERTVASARLRTPPTSLGPTAISASAVSRPTARGWRGTCLCSAWVRRTARPRPPTVAVGSSRPRGALCLPPASADRSAAPAVGGWVRGCGPGAAEIRRSGRMPTRDDWPRPGAPAGPGPHSYPAQRPGADRPAETFRRWDR